MKTRKTKKQLEQHRQRWIAIRAFYNHLRMEAAAEMTVAKAEYDSNEYHTARWQDMLHYGAAEGIHELARSLGIFGSSDYWRLDWRARRIRDAAAKRSKKLREEKYAKIRGDQP